MGRRQHGFTAGAIRLAYDGLEDAAALADISTTRPDTDLAPYTGRASSTTSTRDARPRRSRRWPGSSPTTRATRRWLKGHGVRCRLMYERQSFRVDGRIGFWGNLAWARRTAGRASSTARAAAGRAGIEVRHETAVEDLLRGPDGRVSGVVARSATARGPSCARGRWCSRPGASSPTRGCARRTGAGLGRREGPRDAEQHGGGADPALRHGARPTGSGAAATRSSGTRTRRPPGDLRSPTASHARRIPSGSWSTARRPLRRRGGGLPQLHLREVRCADPQQPGGVAGRCSTPDAARSRRRLRGTRRDARRAPTRWRAPRSAGSTPDGFARTVARVQRGRRDRARSIPPSRTARRTEGITPPKSNWALAFDAPPFVAFRVTCGITFTFGGVRIDDDGRCWTRAAGDPRAVRRRGARRRAVLPQLPGRQRPDGGRRLGPSRGVDGRHDGVIALRHLHARRPA